MWKEQDVFHTKETQEQILINHRRKISITREKYF